MTKYGAFLRGINVGGRIVKMAELKACFEAMGFGGVTTVLQTGNVLFESDKSISSLKPTIEAALTGQFNYPAKVQIVSLSKLQQIVKVYPFDTTDESMQHYVIFMEGNLAAELLKVVVDLDDKVEAVQAADSVVYWRVQKGMTIKSPFSKYLTKAPYKEANTVRNVKTLQKVLAGPKAATG